MQMTAPTGASERSPLSVVWDIIVAPKSAFEALDERPRWVIAYLLICVLGMAGALLQMPAQLHANIASIDRDAGHDPQMASLSPAQLENVKALTTNIQHFIWLAYPVIAIVFISVAALVLWAGAKAGSGRGNFSKYFAIAINVGIVQFGIAYFLTGVLCSLHSPDTFNSPTDISKLTPSLAWIVPSENPKMTTFLEAFTPFTVWSFLLLAFALRNVGKVSPPIAYVTAAIVGFGALLYFVLFAR
jgi:hypothetical protein